MTNKGLEKQDWYQLLVDDCRSIITEAVFTSNWSLVEGYHELGKRITQEKKNFNGAELYGKKITSYVSQSIGKSVRTVERAVQFYKKYPNLNLLPEGKDINWYRVVNKYLPDTIKEREPRPEMVKCPKCGGYYLTGENICQCPK